MRNTIKIKYLDWWKGFDFRQYRIQEVLERYYDVEISEKPDYVFCSLYSKEAIKYNCVRIFYTGENFCPDFNLYDYAIGFEDIQYGDRYIKYPNYLINPKYDSDVKNMLIKHNEEEIRLKPKSEFCSYVVSNGNGDIIRDLFFEELSRYKKVNSGGRYKNNIGLPNGIEDKMKFQSKHKFAIAFENSSHPGYTTEKLIQAFAAGTIPIYWGDPKVTEIFNDKAMIIVNGKQGIKDAIERIEEIDNDDSLYNSMIREPAINDEKVFREMTQEFEDFLVNIFDQKVENAKRRSDGTTVETYYKEIYSSNKKKTFVFGIWK